MEQPTVIVRRSKRRRRSVSAQWKDGTIEVAVPQAFSSEEERLWVSRMVERLLAKENRLSDETALSERADVLAQRYFGDLPRFRSVSWSSRQNGRWGSCTPATGTIRISSRVRAMPGWVLDYVLVHELAHLSARGHGQEFRALVERYPMTGRAEAFLEGVAWEQSRGGWMPSAEGQEIPTESAG